MPESCLLTGPSEPTNEWYAIANRWPQTVPGLSPAAWLRSRVVMPVDLYDPDDNFDLLASHVLPALLAKNAAVREGRDSVEIWRSGHSAVISCTSTTWRTQCSL